jgi:hypothetical protein
MRIICGRTSSTLVPDAVHRLLASSSSIFNGSEPLSERVANHEAAVRSLVSALNGALQDVAVFDDETYRFLRSPSVKDQGGSQALLGALDTKGATRLATRLTTWLGAEHPLAHHAGHVVSGLESGQWFFIWGVSEERADEILQAQ